MAIFRAGISMFVIYFAYLCENIQSSTSYENVHHLVTNLGSLNGKVTQRGSKTIYSYLNIPYAKPPVGRLRFQEPRSYGGWEGVRDATQCGNICPQDTVFLSQDKQQGKVVERSPAQSEDCLTLNVMVPGQPTSDGSLRSVMVWIHGGALTVGDGCSYDGSYLVSGGDVILVTFNYRLGALGFLSTADSTMSGNYGLKDQSLALRWVHENIKEFGGDPDSVTIFGESGGAFSVSFQSLMPENKGLFQKSIIQSGSLDVFPVIQHYPIHIALAVAKELKCTQEDVSIKNIDTEKILDCLLDVPWETLVEVQATAPAKAGIESMLRSPYYPTVDGTIIKKHPSALYRDTTSNEFAFFQSLDIMAGTCSLEGSFIVYMLEMFQANMNTSQEVVGIQHAFACEMLIPILALGLLGDIKAKDLLCDSVKSDDPIIVGQKILPPGSFN